MTNTISSRQPGHVGPVAPNKMTTVISNNFCFPRSVLHGVLGPHFGPHLTASSFLTICSHFYMIIYSHFSRRSGHEMTIINNILYLHDYMVMSTNVNF